MGENNRLLNIEKSNIIIPPNTNSSIVEPRNNLNILDAITILNYSYIILIQIFPALLCTIIFNIYIL
jgi:hypothetical protein